MKRMSMVLALALAAALLAGCGGGSDEVKVIGGEAPAQATAAPQSADAAEETENAAAPAEAGSAAESSEAGGYVFVAESGSGTARITTDIPMQPVLDRLGEPLQYFEAASCAFEGLDKMYTYAHFEIDTYPNGDEDLISSIFLLDDLVATPEGLYVGDSLEDMERLYGDGYTVSGEQYVYEKGGMELQIIISGGAVSSITYASKAAEG